MNHKKVYIVTAGCYSDYGIHAVSLSMKRAQQAIEAAKLADEYWASDASIETWDLDEVLTFKKQRRYICGMLLDDGSVVEPVNKSFVGSDFCPPYRGRIVQLGVKVPCYNNRPIVRTESAVSHKHALKLAIEARQKWLRAGAA